MEELCHCYMHRDASALKMIDFINRCPCHCYAVYIGFVMNTLNHDFTNNNSVYIFLRNGPLTRYVKLGVVHAPGMLGTFSPSPTSKETAS